MSNEIQWIPVIASLLGGGAVGALITASVATYRNRIQPVGYRADALPMFRGTSQRTPIQAKVTLFDGTGEYNFDNLHVLEVEVVNRGNQDRKSFTFGMTLGNGQKAVFVEPKASDRHHVVKEKPDVSPTKALSELDFVLESFNRGDRYAFTVYVVLPDDKQPVSVTFSSPEPVTFSSMPSVGEIVGQLASSATIGFGPFRVSVGLR